MLLAIDAGNTNIVFGVHDGNTWIQEWRYQTLPVRSELEYEMFLRLNFLEAGLRLDEVSHVAISSVVPELNPLMQELSLALFQKVPLLIGPRHYAKLPITTGNPHEIGTDLVANATAAHTIHQDDVIIVDFGTALTFTVIEKSGRIHGVNIAPGLKTAIASLSGSTAQLPEVPLELPTSAIGKNTIHAIQSGVLWGYVSMVEGMLDRIKEEFAREVKVVATGGLSSILHPLHHHFDEVNTQLTLEGIRIINQLIPN